VFGARSDGQHELCSELGQMGNMNEVPPNDDVPSNKTMDINP